MATETSKADERNGIDSEREQEIGQHIGYRYDVNLTPDYSRLTPFLKQYIETMWPRSHTATSSSMSSRTRTRRSSANEV